MLHDIEEDRLLARIDDAIEEAAKVMDLVDAPDDDERWAERDQLFEARHHCGTCQVRTVMEVVWPAIENYITYLKGNHVTAEH